MLFSSPEIEARYEAVYNEEHAQSDVLATSIMLACCAVNWVLLSQPYGRYISPAQPVMLVTLAVCSMAVQLLALANPPLYKRHRTLLMGSLRVVCNLLTTLSIPAYHQYLADYMTANNPLMRMMHLLLDGLALIPAFVGFVFPILWHTHLWLLISAHAHLMLAHWFDCVNLVAFPSLRVTYGAVDMDVLMQPAAVCNAVRYCRRMNNMGQLLSLVCSGVYSWRKEFAHRQQFLKAACNYNMQVGGDVHAITTTQLEVLRRPRGFRQLVFFELLYVFPLCWATLHCMRNDAQLLAVIGLSTTP